MPLKPMCVLPELYPRFLPKVTTIFNFVIIHLLFFRKAEGGEGDYGEGTRQEPCTPCTPCLMAWILGPMEL